MRVGEGISGEKQREERKEREKEKEKKGREKEERKEHLEASSFDLPAFRRLEFVGLRVIVRLLDKGYAPRGRDSSYFGIIVWLVMAGGMA